MARAKTLPPGPVVGHLLCRVLLKRWRTSKFVCDLFTTALSTYNEQNHYNEAIISKRLEKSYTSKIHKSYK
jgi:hypothetical protein